jgi:transposase InsO family protein
MIPPSWPFAVWGLDILGPFPRAVGGYRYLYVAIDKFTKWPEATPVVNITKASATAFLRSIVCRFGVPNRVITDNETQFTSQYFQEYCEDMGIQLCFASVAHHRSNGQVERANAEILRGLKIRTYCDLEKHGTRWIDELPSVLWGNRTTPSRATGEPLSSWSTGPKRAFPRRSPWALYESSLLMRIFRNSSVAKTWTSSTSADGEQQSEMHGTTKRSGATINGSCIVGSSGSVT